MLRDRLLREAEGNVAIRVTEAESKDAFEVAGRGGEFEPLGRLGGLRL